MIVQGKKKGSEGDNDLEESRTLFWDWRRGENSDWGQGRDCMDWLGLMGQNVEEEEDGERPVHVRQEVQVAPADAPPDL